MYQDEVFGAEKRTQVVFEVLLLPLATLCVAVTLPTALGSRVQLATALTARSATTTEANTVNDYDTLHRITAANYVTGSDEAFNYDVLGNRLAGITDRAGTTWNYANNLVNEYTSIDENGINPPAAATPVHDAAGNLTENAAGYAFDYDEENRVTRVYDDTNGNGVWDNTEPNHAEFRYDALGRRVEQTVNRNTGSEVVYRYYQELASGAFGVDAETGGDRANVLVVYTFDDNNEYLARYFVNGPSFIDERVVMHSSSGTHPSTDRFYLYRDLWTVAGIVRASGYVTEEYTYSVYGVPTLYYYPPGDHDQDGDVDDPGLARFANIHEPVTSNRSDALPQSLNTSSYSENFDINN